MSDHVLEMSIWHGAKSEVPQPGSSTKFDLTGTTDGRTISPLCREYTYSRSFPKSQVLAAILEGTITGPVLEVQFVKNLDGHGIKVAIPSMVNAANTSYVVSPEIQSVL